MPNRRAKYDWEKWADGGEHTAVRGKDFHCGVPSFVGLLHNKCARLNVTHVTTSVDGDAVTFKFHLRTN
jgi:hypothetical protein